MTEDIVDNTSKDVFQRNKRKKRKNFLSNAKKYVKKGQMGRGTQIPEELYQYFVGILETIKKGMENEDDRRALVDNVLERTIGEELNIIGNQLGCRLIELLLPYASSSDLERFMEVVSPELRRLCSDNFSSHVVETALKVACERATRHLQQPGEVSTDDSDEETPAKKSKIESDGELKHSKKHIKACNEFTLKICKYAVNNLEDFVWDSYANHILRSALKCLSGITLLPGEKPKLNMFAEAVKENKGIPPHQTSLVYKETPQEYKEIVVEFANRLSSWPQFKDMPFKNITSGLLQVLLFAVKNVDKNLTKSLIKKLLNESFAPDDWFHTDTTDEKKTKESIDNHEDDTITTANVNEDNQERVQGNLPPVYSSEAAVRLLEAALFVAKKKMYTQLYARCFLNRLAQLATMPMLNFTVQRLFDNCVVKEEFEPMFEELSDKYGALLAGGNTGVLVALAKACLRIKAKQTQFLTNLETALQCSDEHQNYFPVCCLRLLPVDRIDLAALDKEYFINVHGSVIMQTILDFQRPTRAVTAVLSMPVEQLLVIFKDAKGSHVADAFAAGQFVGVKARDKMIWRLKGCYQDLALSQHGSRALERLYEPCAPEQKQRIVSELADKSGLLRSTAWGRRVAENLAVELWRSSPDKWQEAQAKQSPANS